MILVVTPHSNIKIFEITHVCEELVQELEYCNEHHPH